MMVKSEQSKTGWYFLIAVLALYAIVALINFDTILHSLDFFLSIMQKIIPLFLIIYILVVLTDYFITPDKLIKHLGSQAGIKSE